VTENLLYRSDVVAALEEMRREGVAKRAAPGGFAIPARITASRTTRWSADSWKWCRRR
jgi:hypothetical protein